MSVGGGGESVEDMGKCRKRCGGSRKCGVSVEKCWGRWGKRTGCAGYEEM